MNQMILEPNDPNMKFVKALFYVNIREQNGDDAEIMLSDLNDMEKNSVANYVIEELDGMSKIHPNIIIKNIRMSEDEYHMEIGNTIVDEDFEVTAELISEYFNTASAQRKFPKIKGKKYNVIIEVEEDK